VFVTFEESPGQLRRNADSFRWGGLLNDSDAWRVIDARVRPGAETSGEFDIDALLGAISAAAGQAGGPGVVIDGIDQLLQRQPDPMTAVDQVRQLNEWCEREGRAMILSGKVSGNGLAPVHPEGVQFTLPTALVLSATMLDRRLARSLRIAKHRGSSHCPDEVPLVMNDDGIQLPYHAVRAGCPCCTATCRRNRSCNVSRAISSPPRTSTADARTEFDAVPQPQGGFAGQAAGHPRHPSTDGVSLRSEAALHRVQRNATTAWRRRLSAS